MAGGVKGGKNAPASSCKRPKAAYQPSRGAKFVPLARIRKNIGHISAENPQEQLWPQDARFVPGTEHELPQHLNRASHPAVSLVQQGEMGRWRPGEGDRVRLIDNFSAPAQDRQGQVEILGKGVPFKRSRVGPQPLGVCGAPFAIRYSRPCRRVMRSSRFRTRIWPATPSTSGSISRLTRCFTESGSRRESASIQRINSA